MEFDLGNVRDNKNFYKLNNSSKIESKLFHMEILIKLPLNGEEIVMKFKTKDFIVYGKNPQNGSSDRKGINNFRYRCDVRYMHRNYLCVILKVGVIKAVLFQ